MEGTTVEHQTTQPDPKSDDDEPGVGLVGQMLNAAGALGSITVDGKEVEVPTGTAADNPPEPTGSKGE